MKKLKLLTAFYFLFILVLIYRLLESVWNGYEKESWHISELLINYRGGFVRRGLLGEVLLYLVKIVDLNPYYLIIGLCLAAYLLLIYFFTNAFVKKGYPVFILPFVFFLGSPIINNFWVRKDIIQLLLFILILYFTTKTGKRFIALINIVLVIGILIHESIAFFGLPFLALLIYHKNYKAKANNARLSLRNCLITYVQLLPSILTFILVIYFKGTASVASKIWESWSDIKFPIEQASVEAPASIDGVSWSLKKGLSYFIDTLKNFEFDIYAPFAWILIILSIYFILTNINHLYLSVHTYTHQVLIDRTQLSSVMLVQLIAVTPLFILGWDYGRWVFLWTSSTFAILLIIPKQTLSEILPSIILTTTIYINRQLDDYLSHSKAFLVLLCLVIGVPSHGWSMWNYVDTVAPVLILQFISEVFYNGVVLIKGVLALC